jgi:aspartyl-tRNA(Asn)/glutamyl-tRNA(Gln) amidotransferase subunit A
MVNFNLRGLNVVQLGDLIRLRKISPVEVAKDFLRRIDLLEPKLNAFITRMDEHVIGSARESEVEIMAGRYIGPLHGIPVGLKDLFWTKGVRTTSGSLLDADFVPSENSAVASRLEAAGACIIGKLHMTEFAFDGTSRNHHYGSALNPWDTTRMAGGSSSGSGVAVASGEVPIALGTDTGGSVRVPAALCGITGLKPTYGLISRYGVTPLSGSMDHVGSLSRTVNDAAIMLNLLSGYDTRDQGSAIVEQKNYLENLNSSVSNLRIGIPNEFVWDLMEPEVEHVFRVAMNHMRVLGIGVDDVSIPELGLINAAGSIVQTSEAAVIYRERVLNYGQYFDPGIRRRMESGLFITPEDYSQAQRARILLRRRLLTAFERFDLLATPTTAIAAPGISEESVMIRGQDISTREALLRITRIFSTVGLPAISIPCGFTGSGLPVGLQLVARPFAEKVLLGAAHAYQKSTEWHFRLPEL